MHIRGFSGGGGLVGEVRALSTQSAFCVHSRNDSMKRPHMMEKSYSGLSRRHLSSLVGGTLRFLLLSLIACYHATCILLPACKPWGIDGKRWPVSACSNRSGNTRIIQNLACFSNDAYSYRDVWLAIRVVVCANPCRGKQSISDISQS